MKLYAILYIHTGPFSPSENRTQILYSERYHRLKGPKRNQIEFERSQVSKIWPLLVIL